jgi:hypothetical protein
MGTQAERKDPILPLSGPRKKSSDLPYALIRGNSKLFKIG